jgi:type I restriction enzyme S subunit
LPLAPLAEQHRIVAEIEKHFTRLDDAVATLERVKTKLKRARASVLKAAVEGRLVPTEAELARAEGRDYESGPVLLQRILAERKRQHGERVEPDDTAELPALPEGWAWAKLVNLAAADPNAMTDGPFGSTLPSLAEQHRIVTEVDRRLSVLDALTATLDR